jgi:uncharacterized membrane-anchored protein
MKKKQYYVLFFAILVLAQLGIAGRMVMQQEQIIQKGKQFLFKAAPIDPNDPFRGKYITLDFEAEQYETTDPQVWSASEEVFVLLRTDPDGFAEVKALQQTPPTDDIPYFKAQIDYFYPQDSTNLINLDFPFDRYYMEESKAPEAEQIYREAFREAKNDIFAVVFISRGKSVLEDVKIGGQSIKDLSAKTADK